MGAEKAQFRKDNLQKLESYSFTELLQKSANLSARFQDFIDENREHFQKKYIVSFYPFETEPQIQIEKEEQNEPFQVAYVRIENWKDRWMEARAARRDLPGMWEEFEVSSGNRIFQPKATQEICSAESIAVVLVPGLAFSKEGDRLGRGAGFYDRFLSRCPEALRVGVTFEDLVYSEVPSEAHDEKLDVVLTDESFYSMRSYGQWKIHGKVNDRTPR